MTLGMLLLLLLFVREDDSEEEQFYLIRLHHVSSTPSAVIRLISIIYIQIERIWEFTKQTMIQHTSNQLITTPDWLAGGLTGGLAGWLGDKLAGSLYWTHFIINNTISRHYIITT